MKTSVAEEKRRLKYVATINDDALGEETNPDYELEYVDIGNVDSSGSINKIAHYRFADAPSRARRQVQDGDVIISTVRTYLQAIAAIESPPNNLIVSTGFAIVRPIPGVLDPNYCKYALREDTFLSEVEKRSAGVSYPAITSSDLADIAIYLHPLERQREISTFLDKEIGHLSALIAEKQRLLELLKEKRTALITQAVTCGLNKQMRTQDSMVDWLGEVPETWEVMRARWLFKERDERSKMGTEELLTVSHLTGVTPRSEKDVNMFEAETTEGYKRCCAGDLVINTLWAWMGAMGIAFQDGIVSPAYNVYEPNSRLEPDFIDLLVRLPVFAQEVTRYSKGVWSSRLRLYPEGFYEVYLPIPPIDEQKAIVAYLAKEETKIDHFHSVAEQSIGLLKERRAALINAAVTGQIDLWSGA